MYSSTVSLSSAINGVGGHHHAPAALPPKKESRFPLYRRLGGPQGGSGWVLKISPPPGFDPWTVQPVAFQAMYEPKNVGTNSGNLSLCVKLTPLFTNKVTLYIWCFGIFSPNGKHCFCYFVLKNGDKSTVGNAVWHTLDWQDWLIIKHRNKLGVRYIRYEWTPFLF